MKACRALKSFQKFLNFSQITKAKDDKIRCGYIQPASDYGCYKFDFDFNFQSVSVQLLEVKSPKKWSSWFCQPYWRSSPGRHQLRKISRLHSMPALTPVSWCSQDSTRRLVSRSTLMTCHRSLQPTFWHPDPQEFLFMGGRGGTWPSIDCAYQKLIKVYFSDALHDVNILTTAGYLRNYDVNVMYVIKSRS